MAHNLEERLRSRSIRDSTNNCLLWQGSLDTGGYGVISFLGKHLRVSRVAWELSNNQSIPEGMWVLHSCDVRNCIEPSHLFIGTRLDNIRDMCSKNRQWKPKGLLHSQRKLSEGQVIEIRNSYKTHRQLSKDFKVAKSLIWAIKNKKVWSHLIG